MGPVVAAVSPVLAIVVVVALLLVALGPLLFTRLRSGTRERDRDAGAGPARSDEQAPPGEVAVAQPPLEVDPRLVAGIEEALAPAAPEAEPAPQPEPEPEAQPKPTLEVAPEPEPDLEAEPRPAVRPRFRDRLTKARSLVGGYVGSVLSRRGIDDETWDEIEEALVRADVGVGLTGELLDDLRARVKAESITTSEALVDALKADLKQALATSDRSLHFDAGTTNVWLFVGVNGVGKTTTIGKVSHSQQAAGRSVVMAAGDTFRAAAADQLELWAKRTGADLVRGAEGGDPASVIFDAIQRAGARKADLVLADTAGRLHTKVNLMEELKKVRRVAERPPGNVTEVLLVLDATTGQNGLVQAKQFAEAVGVTGVVLTKLDGTAKGGIALAIQRELGIPIKLVGLGETVDDLVEFDPDEFVEALVAP